jgi:hypothetical protein
LWHWLLHDIFRCSDDIQKPFKQSVGLVASGDDILAQITDVSSPLIPNQGLRSLLLYGAYYAGTFENTELG